ncbi:MAG: NFACT RNA binding domain-containing protein [Polyangiales bacterium]
MSEQRGVPTLRDAIVQKVDRVGACAFVISVRLPGRSLALLAIGTRAGAAIGPIAKPPKKQASPRAQDAEQQRWRKTLEGSRVAALWTNASRTFWRLELVSGDATPAIVATTSGVTLDLAGTMSVETHGDLAAISELAIAADHAERVWLAETQYLFEGQRQSLRRALAREISKLSRRAEAVSRDVEKIAGADELTRVGSMLSTIAHTVPRGSTEVVVEDWGTGERVQHRISLDPAKSAREQAQAMFHRAKRLKRGRAVAEGRLVETQLAIDRLTSLLIDVDRAGDAIALEIVDKRTRAIGVKPSVTRDSGSSRSEVDKARSPYRIFKSGEHELRVGRGAKDNDALTTQHARPHDLWLHAKGWTGAHVIVPLTKGTTCPAELLVDAAHLAAHFSDARGESIVEVQYAERRYVRKPKGSAPGAVVVDREKVIVLRVDPEIVTRLLASAVE